MVTIKERAYPITLKKDGKGYIATFEGCYGVAEGKTKAQAIANAKIMIDEIFMYAIEDNEELGRPKKAKSGQAVAIVPTSTYLKYLLHLEYVKQGVKRSKLAKSLDVAPMQIDRMFSGKNKSSLYQLDLLAKALGKRINITLVDREAA